MGRGETGNCQGSLLAKKVKENRGSPGGVGGGGGVENAQRGSRENGRDRRNNTYFSVGKKVEAEEGGENCYRPPRREEKEDGLSIWKNWGAFACPGNRGSTFLTPLAGLKRSLGFVTGW